MDFGSSGLPRVIARWRTAGRPGGAGGAREVVVSVRGVAAGVPESRSMLGILIGVSLPLFTAIGDP